jgi:hypothetical protein
VPAVSFALIYFSLAEVDKGFDWLDKAVDEGDCQMLDINVYPILDPFRSHPRYQALLHKMNLEQ